MNRKRQDYVYVKGEYKVFSEKQSTIWHMKIR